jgi:hypothetical protein
VFSGPRRGPNSGVGNIAIELLDEGVGADAHDVDFGGDAFGSGSPEGAAPNRAGKILAATTGVAVLVAAVIWFAGRDGGSTEQASPTVPTLDAGSTESAPTPSEPGLPSTTATEVPSTAMIVNGGEPIAGITDDISLFLTDPDLKDVFQLHLATGVVETISEGDGGLGTVVGIAGTSDDPIVVRSPSYGWTAFRPGPDGTYWEQRDGEAQLIQPGVEDIIRQLSVPWADAGRFQDKIYLVGTTQAGEPVVAGPDGRFYELRPDGTASLFSEGWPRDLVSGNYMTIVCTEEPACVQRIQTTAGSIELPFGAENYSNSTSTFTSPDGRWVVHEVESASGYETVLLDMINGTIEVVEFSGGTGGIGRVDYGAPDGSGQVFRSLWSPDSRYFICSPGGSDGANRGLVVIDVQTGAQTSVPGGPRLLPIAVM